MIPIRVFLLSVVIRFGPTNRVSKWSPTTAADGNPTNFAPSIQAQSFFFFPAIYLSLKSRKEFQNKKKKQHRVLQPKTWRHSLEFWLLNPKLNSSLISGTNLSGSATKKLSWFKEITSFLEYQVIGYIIGFCNPEVGNLEVGTSRAFGVMQLKLDFPLHQRPAFLGIGVA